MYSIDTNIFFISTGCRFHSDMGVRFRQIAVRSLSKVCDDVLQGHESNQALAHKVKGIALSCGAMEVARICLKLEHYGKAINHSVTQRVLIRVSHVMINLCDVE